MYIFMYTVQWTVNTTDCKIVYSWLKIVTKCHLGHLFEMRIFLCLKINNVVWAWTSAQVMLCTPRSLGPQGNCNGGGWGGGGVARDDWHRMEQVQGKILSTSLGTHVVAQGVIVSPTVYPRFVVKYDFNYFSR